MTNNEVISAVQRALFGDHIVSYNKIRDFLQISQDSDRKISKFASVSLDSERWIIDNWEKHLRRAGVPFVVTTCGAATRIWKEANTLETPRQGTACQTKGGATSQKRHPVGGGR